MLLQCEGGEESDMSAAWLGADNRASLVELNEECLELLAQQAHASPAPGWLAEPARLWGALDAAGRRRAAGCLYLLLDAGFADAAHWRAGAALPRGPLAPAFFSVPAAAGVAQAVFTFAWHLARCRATAARLLLGMPGVAVAQLARHTLGQVRALALAHPHWLQPRWRANLPMWRELLGAAADGDPTRLERAYLRGQTLLAAEARHPLGARPARTVSAHGPARSVPERAPPQPTPARA